jgi:hypothetical protein
MSRIIGLRECQGCGELVLVIKTNEGKKMAFDPEPLLIREDPSGDVFFKDTGEPIWGEPAGDAFDQFDDPDSEPLYRAYVPHKGLCPNGGRKRRIKK